MVQRVGPKGNSAAPGLIVRFKPRMLSTAQTVSSCGPVLMIKQQVKASPGAPPQAKKTGLADTL